MYIKIQLRLAAAGCAPRRCRATLIPKGDAARDPSSFFELRRDTRACATKITDCDLEEYNTLLRLHHIQIHEDLAGTGAVFGADDTAVFEDFHEASRTVVADT
jgi:hypothetical protein